MGPSAVSLGPAPASAVASGAYSRAPPAPAAALRGPSLPFAPDATISQRIGPFLTVALVLGQWACSKPTQDWLGMAAIDDRHVAVALGRGERCELGVASERGWLWRSDEPDCAAVELKATTGTIAFRLASPAGKSRLVMASHDGRCRQDLQDARLRGSSPWTAANWRDRRIDLLGESSERIVTSFSHCKPLSFLEVPPDAARAQVEVGYLGFDRIGTPPQLPRPPDGLPNRPIEIRPADAAPYVFAGAMVSAWGPTALLYEAREGQWRFHEVRDPSHVTLPVDRDAVGLLRVVWQRDDALFLFTEKDERTTITRLDPKGGSITASKVLEGTIGGLRKDTPMWWTGDASLGLIWLDPGARAPGSFLRIDADFGLTPFKTGPAPIFAQVGPTAIMWTTDGALHLLEPGRPARLVVRLSPPTGEDRIAMAAPRRDTSSAKAIWWVHRNELRRVDLETSTVDDILSW